MFGVVIICRRKVSVMKVCLVFVQFERKNSLIDVYFGLKITQLKKPALFEIDNHLKVVEPFDDSIGLVQGDGHVRPDAKVSLPCLKLHRLSSFVIDRVLYPVFKWQALDGQLYPLMVAKCRPNNRGYPENMKSFEMSLYL